MSAVLYWTVELPQGWVRPRVPLFIFSFRHPCLHLEVLDKYVTKGKRAGNRMRGKKEEGKEKEGEE